MKLKTKLYKRTEKILKGIPDVYSVTFKGNFFKPEGDIVLNNLDKGYFKVEINDSETRARIIFQLLPFDSIVFELD